MIKNEQVEHLVLGGFELSDLWKKGDGAQGAQHAHKNNRELYT
jgi:hypothetical protein